MSVTVNENDPRVKRTRELLLRSFNELAQEKDMFAISVQDITERATVNRATFYAHFQDKDALMDASFRVQIRQTLSAKLSPELPLTGDNLRLLFRTLRDFLSTSVRRCPRTQWGFHPMVKSAIQEELYGFLLSWFLQKLPVGSACRRHSPEALATLISWALFGAALEWTNSRSNDSKLVAEQVVEMLAANLENSVAGNEAGQK